MNSNPQSLDIAAFEALAQAMRADAISRDARGAAATLLALGDECERIAAGAPDRALSVGEALAATARALNNLSAVARALRATIPALAYSGRLDEALVRADEAQAAADAANDPIEKARAGVASMHALAKLGRTADALERGRISRDALVGAGRRDLAARAELNIANVHKIRGEQQDAIACLERALSGIPESESAARGTVENTLGETLLQLDRMAQAHGAFDRAESLLSNLPLAHAVVIGNRADLLAREGRFGDALREFDKVRSVSDDKKTGLVTLGVRWKDPETAASWANLLVKRLNERQRAQALAESQRNVDFLQKEMASTSVVSLQQSMGRVLEGEMQKLMLARGNEEFAFKVIDPATSPKQRDAPKRALVAIVATLAGGFLGLLAVFLRKAIRERRRPASAAV